MLTKLLPSRKYSNSILFAELLYILDYRRTTKLVWHNSMLHSTKTRPQLQHQQPIPKKRTRKMLRRRQSPRKNNPKRRKARRKSLKRRRMRRRRPLRRRVRRRLKMVRRTHQRSQMRRARQMLRRRRGLPSHSLMPYPRKSELSRLSKRYRTGASRPSSWPMTNRCARSH